MIKPIAFRLWTIQDIIQDLIPLIYVIYIDFFFKVNRYVKVSFHDLFRLFMVRLQGRKTVIEIFSSLKSGRVSNAEKYLDSIIELLRHCQRVNRLC